jgi:diguanylate cyclase (GGDEF)-like protein/PAS domain S-box-containing protein
MCGVFLLSTLAAAGIVIQSEQARIRHDRVLTSGYAKDHARHLEAYIDRAMSATYALAALIETAGGPIPNFDVVAARLLPRYPGASELVLSVGGTIRNVAPLAGNEKALGLDLLSLPAQKAEAALSRDTGQLTLAGPLDLVQGGEALAGRLPVFLPDAAGQPAFWGFAEVVMRLPEALAPANLAELVTRGYHYQLWRIHPQTGLKQIIAASDNAALREPVEETVRVPNGTWTLSLAPARGWNDAWAASLKALLGLLFAGLAAYLAKLLVDLRARGSELEGLVLRRTSDIAATKDHLKAILDAIPDLVWLKSAEGRYISANRQVQRYLGATEEQIIGRTDYDFVGPELAAFFRDNDRKAILAEKPRANEEWLTFADDGYRGLFETVKTPMRDRDGNILGVLGIARDVTARHRAERVAKVSRTRLSVALNATQIGIFDWDLQRDRWYASRVYYTNLGYQPVRGRGDRNFWMDRVHPEDAAHVRNAIESALTGRLQHYEYETRLRHADGTYRWMRIRGKVVESDGELARRIVGIRMDITEQKKAEERVQRLAHYDTLTGLPNRTLLNERMASTLALAEQDEQPVAVLALDIDKFKSINDIFGHNIGDELLIEVAKRLEAVAGTLDTVARIGGDEFVVVIVGADVTRAAQTAQRVLDFLSTPFQTKHLELVITPSIGVALFPGDGKDFDTLFKCADTAMHRAKSNGRNHYMFFTPEMSVGSARNLLLEHALRHAVERNELRLHYQPQVSLTDGRIVGAEALLRWRHPDLGEVPPAEFIPITEDTGQILQIGAWVLQTASRQLRSWLDGGMRPIRLAVNLSSTQLRHGNLAEQIRALLAETALPPGTLELELTEGVAMVDPLGAISLMSELHGLGIRIAIDDFGTGYSSLSYLKRFQASKLKIDQSFTSGITDDPEDRAIVSAIINLAGSLGLRTLAEGVETPEQLAILRTQGCQEAQGFYFSPALPAEQFEALINDTERQARWLA